MMASPHTLVEGVIISSYAIRANKAFIYVRGEVLHVVRRLQRAVQEAYLAGHLGKDIHGSGYDLDLVVHAGAGAYICGEETALLDSLEGRRGQPRLRPPFPAVAGLYASPTVINNVESIASVPSIIAQRRRRGSPRWAPRSPRATASSRSRATSPDPGQYEAPLGITLRELIDLAGGIREGHELKFWTPGGSSTPMLTAEHLDVPSTSRASARPARCSAPARCRSSTRPPAWSARCCAGRSSTSTSPAASAPRAARAPGGWCRRWPRWRRARAARPTSTCCSTSATTSSAARSARSADGAVSPITSSIKYFRDEYLAHLTHGGCPFDPAASTVFATARSARA